MVIAGHHHHQRHLANSAKTTTNKKKNQIHIRRTHAFPLELTTRDANAAAADDDDDDDAMRPGKEQYWRAQFVSH